jgi:hypothetical protein
MFKWIRLGAASSTVQKFEGVNMGIEIEDRLTNDLAIKFGNAEVIVRRNEPKTHGIVDQ